MKTYALIEDKKIPCIFNFTNITIIFDGVNDYKKVNKTWIRVVCFSAKDEPFDSRMCYVVLSKSQQARIDFSYNFDIQFSFFGEQTTFNKVIILSYGFNNFFNLKNEHKLGEIIVNESINIGKNTYRLKAFNVELDTNHKDFLNRKEKMTACVLCKKGMTISELTPIFYYFLHLLQFASFNTQTKIDSFSFIADKQEVDLFINHNLFNYFQGENHYLSYESFGNHKKGLFDFINNYFEKTYPVFINTEDGFNESMLPVVIGAFERIFDKYVKPVQHIQRIIKEKESAIHFDELLNNLDDFKIDKSISNDAFKNFISLVRSYSLPLEEKIDIIYKELLSCLELEPLDFGFVRTGVEFASYQNKARKQLVHGKYCCDDSLFKAIYNIEIFQELIYFMILKYKIECSCDEIKEILNVYHFQEINSSSFLEKIKK